MAYGLKLAGSCVAIALLAGAALAQDKPVAGEVKEGSLAGKTLTFVSFGGIFQDGQVAATKVGALPKSKIKEWIEGSI